MSVTALLMAGGRGTRMEFNEEKPLLRVGGKPMIEHVLKALDNAEKINKIVVAVSKHTPNTTKFLKEMNVKTLETPGIEYHHDLQYAITELELETVLTISADLPLIVGTIIDMVVERYQRCGKPALTVLVPMELKEELGSKGGYVLKMGDKRVTPAGINVIDGKRIDEGELEEETYIIEEPNIALNVNTPRELMIAERLIQKNSRRN